MDLLSTRQSRILHVDPWISAKPRSFKMMSASVGRIKNGILGSITEIYKILLTMYPGTYPVYPCFVRDHAGTRVPGTYLDRTYDSRDSLTKIG